MDLKANDEQGEGFHRVHLPQVGAFLFFIFLFIFLSCSPPAALSSAAFPLLFLFNRLLIGTWNVNGRYCTENLGPWLNSYTESEPHIVVLG